MEKYERYREKNVEAKQKVEEAKRMSNFKWGQDFDRSYEENKKKFWKEVRRVRKGGSRTEKTVKDVNGRLLRGNEARKRWAEYFEELLNVQEDREADIVAVGGVQVPVMREENEREITIEEVKRALNETRGGKAPGRSMYPHSTAIPRMLKFGKKWIRSKANTNLNLHLP